MPWYKISQNNSGGVFDKEKGEVLFIKSKDLEQANAAYAEYVLDKDTFVYCPCCGSRWQYEVTEADEVTVESVLLDYARDKRRDVAIRFLNAKTGDIVDFKQAADTGAFRS